MSPGWLDSGGEFIRFVLILPRSNCQTTSFMGHRKNVNKKCHTVVWIIILIYFFFPLRILYSNSYNINILILAAVKRPLLWDNENVNKKIESEMLMNSPPESSHPECHEIFPSTIIIN